MRKNGMIEVKIFLTSFSAIFLFAVIALVCPTVGTAQITEGEAIKIARSSGCVAGMFPDDPEFRRFIRREDLEDQLFSLRAKNLTPPMKPAYVFEVYETGTYITEKNEVYSITSTGWDHKLIAV